MQAAYDQFVASEPSTAQAQQLIKQLLAKKARATAEKAKRKSAPGNL